MDQFERASHNWSEQILHNAEGHLQKGSNDHRVMASEVMDLLDALDMTWNSKIKGAGQAEQAVAESSKSELTRELWQDATVKWLSTPDFLLPPGAPK